MSYKEFFSNGYGVSIISHDHSYGLELAVLKGNEDTWAICYDTPITNDVLGYLEPEQLTEVIKEVKALPRPIDAKVSEGSDDG